MEFSVATASRKWKKDPTRKRDGYGEAPGRTASTGGRDRPAPWSPRQLSRGRGREKGAVSRPERSGGRVTATTEAGRHAGVAPTRKNGRPRPPVSDEEGVRRLSGAPHTRPGPGASERSEVAPGPGNKRKRIKEKTGAQNSCLRGRAERQDAEPIAESPRFRQSERSDVCRDRAKGKYLQPEGRAGRREAVVRRVPEAGRKSFAMAVVPGAS